MRKKKNNNEPVEISVVSTMAGPLWARATYSKLYPEILHDPKSAEIVEKIDADFSKVDEFMGEFLGINFIVRARSFDNAVKKYLERYPNATVVNLGCGLDTTFYRVDNGKIKWYDLDLPEAIEYRKPLIPETDRSRYISKSMLDYSWFDDVVFNPENGIFFIAAGLFNYFKEDEIISLCKTMAERFPGGELMFDVPSKLGLKILNRRLKKSGYHGVTMYFGLGNPKKEISKWSNRIQLIDSFTLFVQMPRNPKWQRKTIRLMNLSDRFKVGKYVQLSF